MATKKRAAGRPRKEATEIAFVRLTSSEAKCIRGEMKRTSLKKSPIIAKAVRAYFGIPEPDTNQETK